MILRGHPKAITAGSSRLQLGRGEIFSLKTLMGETYVEEITVLTIDCGNSNICSY